MKNAVTKNKEINRLNTDENFLINESSDKKHFECNIEVEIEEKQKKKNGQAALIQDYWNSIHQKDTW